MDIEAYTYKLTPEEGGGFSASVEELEGCFSQGETADEAMANIREAALNWIEATLRQGRPIPLPSK